jgi:hypothetical protein
MCCRDNLLFSSFNTGRNALLAQRINQQNLTLLSLRTSNGCCCEAAAARESARTFINRLPLLFNTPTKIL